MSSEEKGLEGMFSDWGLSWGGWLDNRRGEWWLLAQLILISAHLLPPWPAPAVLGLETWPRPACIVGVLLLLSGIVMAAGLCRPRQQPLSAAGCQAGKPPDPPRALPTLPAPDVSGRAAVLAGCRAGLGQPCPPSAADGTDRCAGVQSPPGGTFPT